MRAKKVLETMSPNSAHFFFLPTYEISTRPAYLKNPILPTETTKQSRLKCLVKPMIVATKAAISPALIIPPCGIITIAIMIHQTFHHAGIAKVSTNSPDHFATI